MNISSSERPPLKKVLTSIHVWALAVGLVISGEYFGWNYGWGVAGTVGFLIATLIITLLYITFIFSFTELTTAIPHAGGPFAYSFRAFGPWGGLIAGYATLIEFLLATPAIAFALGSYMHFLYPSLPSLYTAIACYLLFTLINMAGIKESAIFSLLVTILAIAELLVFMGIIAPHFESANFLSNALPVNWTGVFAALPFAIWFYLAIEGVAMVAEEVKDPHRNIPKGYITGIFTLTLLALGVMVLAGGVTDWRKLSAIDYPLPETIGLVLGKDNSLQSFLPASDCSASSPRFTASSSVTRARCLRWPVADTCHRSCQQ
jgi:ethanolamine permease